MKIKKLALTIHEITKDILKLPLHNYTLTFDDGLYSQYYYFSHFQKIPTKKTYFISSGIICNNAQSLSFPECSIAHQKAFSGNTEDYMNVEQIKMLMDDPLVTIGGHSHNHTRLSTFPRLVDKIHHIKKDTEMMLEWFNKHLNFQPTSFCFPYNEDLDGMYQSILKQYGFTSFYGRERIPIETLQLDLTQTDNHDTLPV
jgi:peptidoglycan/xylan/chitin deacetylase (PgdA/CDA1 family)